MYSRAVWKGGGNEEEGIIPTNRILLKSKAVMWPLGEESVQVEIKSRWQLDILHSDKSESYIR